MRAILISALFSMTICTVGHSQRDFSGTIIDNTDIFEGKWIAQVGDKSYELTLKREMIKLDRSDKEREIIWGKIIYKENGEIVRETAPYPDDAILKFVSLTLLEPYRMHFIFEDRERSVRGFVELIVDENDNTLAVFKHGRLRERIMLFIDEEEAKKPYVPNTYDIADGLIFTKIAETEECRIKSSPKDNYSPSDSLYFPVTELDHERNLTIRDAYNALSVYKGKDWATPLVFSRYVDWGQASYSSLLGEDIVEAPLQNKVWVHQIMREYYDYKKMSSIDRSISNTSIRFIAGMSDTGIPYCRFVYINPSTAFNIASGIHPSDLSIKDIEENYSGWLLYYDPEKGFLEGYIVRNGAVTKKMHSDKQAKENPMPASVHKRNYTTAEISQGAYLIIDRWNSYERKMEKDTIPFISSQEKFVIYDIDGKNELLSISDARTLFSQYGIKFSIFPRVLSQRKSSPHTQHIDWGNAHYSILFGHDIMEVPVKDIWSAYFKEDAPPEKLHIDTKSGSVPSNVSMKLISGIDSRGEPSFHMLYIIPDTTFLAETGLAAYQLTLRDIDKNYSGRLLFYDIEGYFKGGQILYKGKVTHMLYPQDKQPPGVSSRNDIFTEVTHHFRTFARYKWDRKKREVITILVNNLWHEVYIIIPTK